MPSVTTSPDLGTYSPLALPASSRLFACTGNPQSPASPPHLLIPRCTTGTSATEARAQSSAEEHEAPGSADLPRRWKRSSSMSDSTYQEAVIEDDAATLHGALENSDARSLYRVRRFEAPSGAAQGPPAQPRWLRTTMPGVQRHRGSNIP